MSSGAQPIHLPDSLIELIKKSSHISVLTGAGISAESGVSTFRGPDGLWSKFRPEELANMNAFMANPALVWEWYQYRRDIITHVQPNEGHKALAKWESLSRRFTLITQNVDGLHEAAGSRNIIELHGNIRHNRCLTCGKETTMDEITFDGLVPQCSCGGTLRPGVVWFGESLPEDAYEAAVRAAQTCELFLTIGTSAVVYPAAALPELALSCGISVIEINPEETSFTSDATFHLHGTAGAVLPQLVNIVEQTKFGLL